MTLVGAGLTVEVTDGLAAEWSSLAGDGPLFASPGWLRAMTGRLGERILTIVVRRDGRPTLAGFGSVQAAHRPGELFDLYRAAIYPGPELPLTERSRAMRVQLAGASPPPQRWQPYLLVMLPGYECTPVGPAARDPAAIAALVDAAMDWARAKAIPTVAMLYLRPESTVLAAALTARDFVRFPLAPAWELRLPGAGMADYLAAQPRKRRIEARRELRRLAEAGVRIEPVDADSVFDDLAMLRCQLVAKYRGRGRDLGHERARLRRIVDDVAGGRPHVLLATAAGAPVGFALFAEHRGEWHCLAVGSDYDDPRSRLTYFGTAYYRAAELAYAHGVRTLCYGIGAWQAKRARGCQATALSGLVHTTDPELAAPLRQAAAITELAG